MVQLISCRIRTPLMSMLAFVMRARTSGAALWAVPWIEHWAEAAWPFAKSAASPVAKLVAKSFI